MANFSFNGTTIAYTESGGVVSAAVNLEGSADGFGTVFGTLTAHGAGTPSGSYEFVLVNYPEAGDQVTSTGSGEWSKIDADTWSLNGTSSVSSGETFKHQSELRLSTRTWSGTFA